MYRNFIKVIIDYFLATLLLILLSPLMFFIYLILFFKIGTPFFFQKRPGLNNKSFVLYKFKTILDKKCIFYNKKNKYFKLGLFLRNTGLDELPQLINILKGDISLVGPRPLRINYLKIKAFKNHVRNKCKPGITGLAQLESYNIKNDKKNSRWEKNFKLDEYYFFNLSFLLDSKILFLTFFKFIKFSKKNDFIKETKLLKKHIK